MKFKRKGEIGWELLGLLIIIGCIALSVIFTYALTVDKCRGNAIEAGVAKWTINPTTGEKTFEYLKTFEFIEQDKLQADYNESDKKGNK